MRAIRYRWSGFNRAALALLAGICASLFATPCVAERPASCSSKDWNEYPPPDGVIPINVTFRHVDPAVADVIMFRSPTPIALDISAHRDSRIDAIVSVRNPATGVERKVCRLQLRGNQPLFGYRIDAPSGLSAVGETLLWSVSATDSAGGGPTGERPYAATLSAYALTAKLGADAVLPPHDRFHGYWQALSASSDGTAMAPCVRSQVALRPRSVLEVVNTLQASGGTAPSPLVTYTRGSQRIYLRTHTTSDSTASVVARFFMKSSGEHGFVPICQATLSPSDDGTFVVAEADWTDSFKPFWRIELWLGGDASFDGQLLRERGSVGVGEQPLSNWGRLPTRHLCMTGNAPRARTIEHANRATSFGRLARFDVTIKSEVDLELAAWKQIEHAILEAFATWRYVCWHCGTYNFARLTINGHEFVQSQAYAIVRRATGLQEASNSRWNNAVGPWNRAGSRGTGDVSYVRVTQNDKALSSFCEADASSQNASAQKLRETNFCDARPASDQRITLKMTSKLTGCSNEDQANVVACEANRRKIELNIADFSFFIDSHAAPIVGYGKPVNLTETLIHESGHWLGVEHTHSRDSIMNEHVDDTRCIDRLAIDQLNDIVQGKVSAPSTSHALRHRGTPPAQ